MIDIIGEFARSNALIKTIFFNEEVYFFTDEAIYQIAVDGSEIEIVDWFEKLKIAI